MSSESAPSLPARYRLLSGPFPLLKRHNLYWISLVDTALAGKSMEAGVSIYSGRDGACLFWYPEEALAALAILKNLETQLVDLLGGQGIYTQQNRNEDDEPMPD